MDSFTRIVLGYHGCTVELANRLISGEQAISDWPYSRNAYDWLGHGIYFWEYGPQRAKEWSIRNGRDGGVVGAHIQLGKCLDLTDTRYTAFLAEAYDSVREMYAAQGLTLPVNERKYNELDCLVINEATDLYGDGGEEAEGFQTVRCPFLEGKPAFEGSMIRLQSHIQLAVIDPECILGVFVQTSTLDEAGIMERDVFTRRERKIIEARRKRSPQERFDALVKKGIIDAEGKVLVRMPDGMSELESAKDTG